MWGLGDEAEFVAVEKSPTEVGHTVGTFVYDDAGVGFFF